MEITTPPGLERGLKGTLRRCRRVQAGNAAVLLLYLLAVVGRPLWALYRAMPAAGDRVPLGLLGVALFLGPPALFCLWYIARFQRAIRRVERGELLVLRGEVTAGGGRQVTVRETLPPGMKKSSWQHLCREHRFRLPPCSRDRDLRVGEAVTLWYPADRILWVGMPAAVWAEPREKISPSL